MLVHVKSLLLFGFVVNVLLHQLYKTFSPGNGRKLTYLFKCLYFGVHH